MHPTSHTTQSPSTSRSVISRITFPFTAKVRHISDFRVEIDEPHRQYAPCDVVKGVVTLTVHKPVRITHIVLCLHGFIKVLKHATVPGEKTIRDNGFIAIGRGKRGTEYFGNGFASIFEDEIVLCGEGRLNVGDYRFKFERQLPYSGVPNSIDFEQGTISYMLTATITRPTTIAPTFSCDRKIYIVDSVDIASIRTPKPKIITLEPIVRRSKVKSPTKTSMDGSDSQSVSTKENTSQIDENGSVYPAADETPDSPVPSEMSSTSVASSSHVSFRTGTKFVKDTKTNDGPRNTTLRSDKTISATAELLRGGCLPGDLIPVQITINHTKVIKSLQGIIVTLYRLGRTDPHPAMPIGPSIPGKKPVYEDYYPKSKTGLSGLSLSSAGASHVYRKDLAQTFAPLIANPHDTAVIKTAVRIPEDVFPTLTGVPGAMISFNYFVEIIMDLGGKLATQDRYLPRLSMTGAPSMLNHADSANRTVDGNGNPHFYGLGIQDTDQMRREKSVVHCVFEVVVGTRDSERKNIRQRSDLWEGIGNAQRFNANENDLRIPFDEQPLPSSYDLDGHEGQDYEWDYPQEDHVEPNMVTPTYQNSVSLIPPPPPEEEPTDEKSRIRMAEQRLLPSAPQMDGSSTSTPQVTRPSAPTLDDIDGYGPELFSAPAYTGLPSSSTMANRFHFNNDSGNSNPQDPTAAVQDDKQEMERQRLLAAVSAPDDDGEAEGSGESHPNIIMPSAPVFDENDEYQPPLMHPTMIGTHNPLVASSETSSTDIPPIYQK